MDLREECRGAKKIGISGHIRPDGDCVGVCLSLRMYLRKLLPEAEVTVYLQKPSEEFSYLKGYDEIQTECLEQDPFDIYFALDCSGDRVGSACEVLYHIMDAELIDRDIAEALYTGIIHDTGVFQYSNTTPETLQAAAFLISFGFNFPKLIEESFYQKTYLQTQIMGRALMESIRFMDGRCIVSMVDRKTMDFYNAVAGDLDGIVNQLRNIKGIDCAIFMYETGVLEYKVSMRSNENVDVAKVASFFGGGGHVRAAGCTMKGTFHDCVNNLSLHIDKQLRGEQD